MRHYAIGIGRVGARCGCVFPIEPNSWVTDNALYSSNIKDGYNLEFLIHWLNYKSLNQYANTSAQPVISLKRISSVTIPKINFLMQEEIAKLLNKVINEEPIESDSWGVCDTLKTISYLEKYFAESDVQSNYLSLLRQSILQEAIEGKLTQAWRKKNSVRKGDPDFDANA
ncbi:MAG: restriction endonuclease subunit S, partial [Candidatus Brocadiae bacterium]|nr:restriction endonuclease subunit S [Candidatus Brocadiia bacterium]